MQLEHSSVIYNHQQTPPMYIYTNPHKSQHSTNFTNVQIHQVTYSIMTQFINHSNACNVLDSSRCMRYRHQQQRSSPQDANRTSYVRVHLLLQFTYVKVHLLLHFSYDSI